jgi:hypothetical protein
MCQHPLVLVAVCLPQITSIKVVQVVVVVVWYWTIHLLQLQGIVLAVGDDNLIRFQE